MTLLVPTVSEKTLADFMLGVTTPGNQKLKLFVNNYTPVDASVAADFTEMSTLSYAEKTLTKTSWVTTEGAAGAAASAAYAAQTWTFTAGSAVTVYGYYITDVTTGKLLWAENFATPKVVQNNGDQIIITPTITFSRV